MQKKSFGAVYIHSHADFSFKKLFGYLILKLKILSRYTIEVGYLAIVFYPIVLILIFRLVYILSSRPYGYLYTPFLIVLTIRSIHHNRKDLLFLKIQISNWRLMVFVEYLFWLSPILIFLILIGRFLSIPILVGFLFLSIILPQFKFRIKIPLKLKVSKLIFVRESFEWLAGIRKSSYLILLVLMLMMAILFNNKIGMVIISAGLLITVANFYVRCENRIWIWLYPLSPANFLLRKLKHFIQLMIPYMLLLLGCFLWTNQTGWVYLSFPAFSLVIINSILVKYIYVGGFPLGHQLMQAIILICGLSIYLNPFMLMAQLLFFFYLFVKAHRTLKSIL